MSFQKLNSDNLLIRNLYVEVCAIQCFRSHIRQSSTLYQVTNAIGICERKKNQQEILERTLKEAIRIKYYKFSEIVMVRSGTTFPLIFQNVINVGIRRAQQSDKGKGQELSDGNKGGKILLKLPRANPSVPISLQWIWSPV